MSVAVIIAVGVNTDGVREILGLEIGPSEAEPFWTSFLRSLTRRGLRGVKLVISDAHEGLKAAAAKVLSCTWQRCKVHFLRNALAHAGKGQRQMVLALINTIFAQETPDAASDQWRTVADQLRERFPKLAQMMDEAEPDVLAFMSFPKAHRTQIHSTNPLERLNAEIKRRTNVVGIFPIRPYGTGESCPALWCAGISARKGEIHMPERGGVGSASPAGWPRLVVIRGGSAWPDGFAEDIMASYTRYPPRGSGVSGGTRHG